MSWFVIPRGGFPGSYDVDNKLGPGSVWRMRLPVQMTCDIALYGGMFLSIKSNNPTVVPNDGFKERVSGDLRILTMTGLTAGTAMLEASELGSVKVSLQVRVGF